MTTYKIEKKRRIFEPELWGANLIDGAISPTGQLIAVKEKCIISDDHKDNVFIYDLNGIFKFSFLDRQEWQEGLSFLGDDYHIVIAGSNDTLRKYTLGEKGNFSHLHREENARSQIQLKAVSDYGNLLLYKNLDHLVCINTNLMGKIFEIKNTGISHAQFSPNDKYLGINSAEKNMVLSTKNGETLWESNGYNQQLFLCFSPDNKNFITSSYVGGKLEIWDTKTWTKASESQDDVKYNQFYIGAYSPDRKIFATGPANNGIIYLWNTSNFGIIGQAFSPHNTTVRKIKFTFDNNELITIGEKDIIVWQIHKEQTTTKNVEVHVQGNVNNSNLVIGDKNEVGSKSA